MKRTSWLTLLLASGCVSINTNAATPTAIERQLLGAYDELDRDLVMAASVRGDVRGAPHAWEGLRALALEGRALMRFNEDDVRELKTARCVAEGRSGELLARDCSSAELGARVGRVVEQENRARRAVVTFAAYAAARERGRTVVAAGDVSELWQAYQRLLRQAAQPGDLFEAAPGEFAPVVR
jgi:hypothetical protein